MNLLLDTHVALWMLLGDTRLPAKAIQMIIDLANAIFVSLASLWEVAIKHAAHPEKISLDSQGFFQYIRQSGYQILPIEAKDIFALGTLRRRPGAPKHQDPFDRMLLAQAKNRGLLFLTHDARLLEYQMPNVWQV